MFNIKLAAGRAGYGCVVAMVAILWMSPASAGDNPAIPDEPTTADATLPTDEIDEATAEQAPEEGMEEPSDPAAAVREAVKNKLAVLREEAKAKVREIVAAKAAEFKQRVKDKIRDKIEAANEDDNGGQDGLADTPTFRRAAKSAIKRDVVERTHQGRLARKLAQLRRQ